MLKTPPDDEATIDVTTGRIHVAVTVSKECSCWTILMVQKLAFKHMEYKTRNIHGVNTHPTAGKGDENV